MRRGKLPAVLLCVLLALLTACGGTSSGNTASSKPSEMQQVSETDTLGGLADGIYELDAFDYSGGSGKVTISCKQIRVESGEIFADIVFSSSHYQYVKTGGVQYDPVDRFAGLDDPIEGTGFEIPVTLQADNEILGMTTAMSQPHEVSYTLHFGKAVPKGRGEAAADSTEIDMTAGDSTETDMTAVSGLALPAFDPADFPELGYISSMETQYAQCFAVHYFEKGYKLFDILGGGRFLVIPEGADAPKGIPEDVTLLSVPDHIYMAATAVMSFFEAIGAEDAVTMTGTDADGWQIEGPAQALADGRMQFMGKYSQPDYEGLTAGGCDLAIESTMILHTPDVKEKLEELGIPVLVDRSSYEPEPLGRTEWIRFYGALMGLEAQSDACFEKEAAYVESIGERSASGKKIAYFAVNSTKTVDIHGGEDYIVKMIRQAGGSYAFDDLAGVDGKTSSVSISMEEFYACAADADYLVYNASIQTPLTSVASLIAENPLLADFKAVREKQVWQVRRSLYQSSDKASRLVLDFAEMMDGGSDTNMLFLEKVGE